MATDAPPPSKEQHRLPSAEEFAEVQQSAEFTELRRSFRSFAFPLTIAFVAWYLLYVLLSNYAGDFMGTKVFGNINVALVLGLAQFVTTFLIAWWYARHAAAQLDPKAEAIKSRMEGAE
ncbi:membrane protein [Streptomyces fumigatiscleroticus]|nr:membrane protein [Streptomyces fumigatiscleroticus]